MTVEDLIDLLRDMPSTARVEVLIATREPVRYGDKAFAQLMRDHERVTLLDREQFTPLSVNYNSGIVEIRLDESSC